MKKAFGHMGNMLATHASAVFLTLILSLPIMSVIKNDTVLAVLAVLLYAMMMYSAAWNKGFRDSRKVGESFPNFKAVIIGILLACIVPVVLLALRVTAYHVNPYTWRPMGEGSEMIKTTSGFVLITDIIYRIYFIFAVGLLKGGRLGSYILPMFIPGIFYIIGYAVGLTRFSIMEKYLPFLIYKPKNKDKKKS